MKLIRLISSMVIILILITGCGSDSKSPTESPQEPFWERVGPEDVIFSFAVDKTGYMYAGTHNGVLLSTDNGKTWKNISDGLPGTAVYDIEVNTNNTVFVTVDTYGVYRLNRYYMTWTRVIDGLPTGGAGRYAHISDLFASDNQVMYAGTKYKGLYICTDNNGNQWEPFNNGYDGMIYEGPARNIYERGQNLFFTTNNDVWIYSWSEKKWLKTELADIDDKITGFVANENAYFASTRFDLLKSVNGINNWENLGKITEEGIGTILGMSNDLFIGTDNLSTIDERGILRSSDNGNTWELLDNNGLPQKIHALIFNTLARLLVGSSEGIFRSTEPIE